MIGRIRTSCTCWRRDKKLVIPAKGPSTKRVIRLCRRCGLRFGAEDEVCWIGLGERMGMGSSTSVMAGTRPGAKSRQGDFFSPFPLLSPVASPQHSTTPILHSPQDSLQPFPPFPSVSGGGRKPPPESGAAERTECEQRLESI